MEDRETMMNLARRALAHAQAGTTDQAPSVLKLPVGTYFDQNRHAEERARIFKQLPLALCLSVELPDPGDFVARDMLDTPVLVIRGNDGEARAFLNVCRHRGARVCPEGKGNQRVFACPYHAWVYDRSGTLTGAYGQASFGPIDLDINGLVPLPTEERCGVVWVCLTPDLDMDIDAWLGDFAPELDTLELNEWHLFSQCEIPGPGWKVTMDGYLETYHHSVVHRDTLSQHTLGNLLVLDTFGPHQRLTLGRKSLLDLADVDDDQWNPGEHLRLIHSIFPNFSLSGILGDHCLVSQILPGKTWDTTVTIQTVLSAKKPEDDAALQKSQAFKEMAHSAVDGEDYVVGRTIQNNLSVIRESEFLIGRNEPAIQNYHRWVAHFMDNDGMSYE